MSITNKQKGTIVENLVVEQITFGINGALTCYTPNADDDGLDLIVNRKGDLLTLKVYSASEYPIKDEEIIKVNDWMCIVAQCDAEKGRHYLGKSGGDWINELHYEFPKSSISGGSGIKSSITITAVDLENDLVSCSFKLGEYINFKDALKGEKAKKSVLFKGKNIPFKRYPR